MEHIKKALIAMSGGVDSSVAAALMLERGYECIGVTMKLFRNETACIPKGHSCCSLEDVEDARDVAQSLGMRHFVYNFAEDFSAQVIDRFVKAYEEGETPNPCIDCNRYLKFERLLQRAMQLGCETMVTGHYARSCYDEKSGRWQLWRARNLTKDQSYVLACMTQEQLAHTVFPLGEIASKEEVRRIAARFGFGNAAKHDSQDICFVPDGDYASFIESYTGKTYPPGDFVTEDGRVLGQHKGIIRYTIGQRKGLGLALPSPLYVKEKDTKENRVILSPNEGLYETTLTAGRLNWISIAPPDPGMVLTVRAKPRYRASEAEASVLVNEDGTVTVTFREPQRALTPGQMVVFYDGERVLGGGTILAKKSG